MLQTSTSLGSLALYRSSVQSIVYTISTLFITLQMAVQGVFLMGAFCASMEIEPFLQPRKESRVKYESWSGGMKIEARYGVYSFPLTSRRKKFIPLQRNLSYTYSGCTEPALRDVSFTLEAGETLAVVGYNGSGEFTPPFPPLFTFLPTVQIHLLTLPPRQVNSGKGPFPHSRLPLGRAAHQRR